jgi:hypothetical protein
MSLADDGLSEATAAPAIICESTFRGWWQAAACPDSYSASGGSSCEQISVAHGHRVWK